MTAVGAPGDPRERTERGPDLDGNPHLNGNPHRGRDPHLDRDRDRDRSPELVVVPPMVADPVFLEELEAGLAVDAAADAADDLTDNQPPAVQMDPHAFADLYVRYRSSLAIHASRFLHDKRDVDEVIQEAYLRVFLVMPEIDNELQALAYARRTVTNLCIDRYRRDQRRPMLVDLDAIGLDLADESYLEDPLEVAEDAAVVRQALALLSPTHRTALIKREVEGKPVAQVAAEMNVPEATIKHTLVRARRALRRLLVGTSVDPMTNPAESVPLRDTAAVRSLTRPAGIAMVLLLAVIGTVVALRPTHSGTLNQAPNSPLTTAIGTLKLPHGAGSVPVTGSSAGASGGPSTTTTHSGATHPTITGTGAGAPALPPATTHSGAGSAGAAGTTTSPASHHAVTPTAPVTPAPSASPVITTPSTPVSAPPVTSSPVASPPVTSPPITNAPVDTAAATFEVVTNGQAQPAVVSDQVLAVNGASTTSSSTLAAGSGASAVTVSQAVTQSQNQLQSVAVTVTVPQQGSPVAFQVQPLSSAFTPQSNGTYQVTVSGTATPLDPATLPVGSTLPVAVNVRYAPNLTQVIAETVQLGKPFVPSAPTTPASPAAPSVDAPAVFDSNTAAREASEESLETSATIMPAVRLKR